MTMSAQGLLDRNCAGGWQYQLPYPGGPGGGGGSVPSSDYLPITGGALTGNLYLNVATPTAPLQAATKAYVDTQVAQADKIDGGVF